MPLYRCTSPHGELNDGQRAAIAQAITAIHCHLTNAPPTFVHVQFHDHVPGAAVLMRTSTTPASWILEGGRVLPEPGEEAAWLADHA